MATTGSRISVEVTATGAEARAELARVSESIKGLGDVISKTSKLSTTTGAQTVRVNREVATSYQQMAAAASRSASEMKLNAMRMRESELASYRHAQAIVKSEEAARRHTGALAALGSGLDKAGGKLNQFGHTMAPISFGLIALGGYSVKAAMDFEKSMVTLQTQAGASSRQVELLRQGILKMAPTVGKTPEQLAQGMYHVVSAMNATIKPAERVNQELRIQREAAVGASIGHSNLEETTYALVSALSALYRQGGQAHQTMAELNAIVGAGDLRMEGLLGALSTGILGTAQTFGISLKSVGAAIDTITKEGTPATQTATRLRMAITLLGAPSTTAASKLKAIGLASDEIHARTTAMSEALQKAGLTTTQLSGDLRKPDGLLVALTDLKHHMEAAGLNSETQAALISRAFGGGRMGTSIMQLYNQLPELQKNYNNQLKITGQYSQDWQRTQQTTTFHLEKAKASLSSTAITIGQDLKPEAEHVLKDVANIAEWFTRLPPSVRHTAEEAAAIAAALAPAALAAGTLFKVLSVPFKVGGALKTGLGGLGGGLYGARGTTALAGSAANPVAVALVDGGIAGLGGKAAPIGTSTVTAGEQAASGGIREFLSGALKRGIAGAGITVGGSILGSAVGGKPGSVISGASTGAGIGFTVAGAPGAAVGGALGALETLMGEGPQGYGLRKGSSRSLAELRDRIHGVQQEWDRLAPEQRAQELQKLAESVGRLESKTFFSTDQKHQLDELHRKLTIEQQAQAFIAQRASIENTIRGLDASLAAHPSAQTRAALILNYDRIIKGIGAEMQAGLVAVQQGNREIDQALLAEAKLLGVTPQQLGVMGSKAVGAASQATGAALKSLTSGFAPGGFVGSPRQRGRDEIPIMVGKGEAVLNHQQQHLINSMMNGVTLDDVFAATRGSKHYMAEGGYAGYSLPLPRGAMSPGAWSIDQGVDIPAPAGTPEFAIGPGRIIMEGLSGFGPNAPVLQLGAGPLKGRNVYYGHAGPDLVKVGAGVTAGQQISSVGAGIVGISTGPHIEIGFGPPFGKGNQMAEVLRQLMGGAGVTGIPGSAPAGINTPAWKGPGGLVGALGRGVLAHVADAANSLLAKATGAGVGPANVPGQMASSGDIMQIAKAAAAAEGVPWDEGIVRELLSKESSGGQNLPPHYYGGGLDPAGPFQVISSTFRDYAVAGHTDRMNPMDNALAAFSYIKHRYGSLASMASATGLFGGGYQGYSGGGILGAYGGLKRGKTVGFPGAAGTKTAKGKAKGQRPGSHVGKVGHPLPPSALQDLASISGTVQHLWDDAQTKSTMLSGLQARFQAEEGEERFLNPDGSLNTAGLAKKTQDDQELVRLEEQVVGDYEQMLSPVSGVLGRLLGSRSNVEGEITRDQRTIAKDNQLIGRHKLRIGSLRKALLDLKKPIPDAVGALTGQLASTKAHWDPLIKAAERHRREYRPAKAPTGTAGAAVRAEQAAHRTALADAVTALQGEAEASENPLKDALIKARAARAAHKHDVEVRSFGFNQQISSLTNEDLKISLRDKGLKETITSLKEVLGGAGGNAGANTQIGLVENIASQLGTVEWDARGHFAGINTTDQGAAYNARTQLIGLQNDLAGVGRTATQVPASENSQLIALLRQQNAQLAESYALSQAQFAVLAGFTQNIPHYSKGGPVLQDGLIYAHRGEHVVPTQGTLVREGGQVPVTVHNNFQFAPELAPLVRLIDQRVQHPSNVQVISRTVGQRTGMLAGAPGGFRGH